MGSSSWPSKCAEITFYVSFGVGSAVLAVTSLAWAARVKLGIATIEPTCAAIVVGLWAIGPPLWLWRDWFGFRKPKLGDSPSPEKVAMAQHSQSVIRALWAAIVGVLAIGFGLLD